MRPGLGNVSNMACAFMGALLKKPKMHLLCKHRNPQSLNSFTDTWFITAIKWQPRHCIMQWKPLKLHCHQMHPYQLIILNLLFYVSKILGSINFDGSRVLFVRHDQAYHCTAVMKILPYRIYKIAKNTAPPRAHMTSCNTVACRMSYYYLDDIGPGEG